MRPARRTTEQSQHVFIRTTGVTQCRSPRFLSRHNFCGHTSEFPHPHLQQLTSSSMAPVLVSAQGPSAVPAVCRASAAILNIPSAPPWVMDLNFLFTGVRP